MQKGIAQCAVGMATVLFGAGLSVALGGTASAAVGGSVWCDDGSPVVGIWIDSQAEG